MKDDEVEHAKATGQPVRLRIRPDNSPHDAHATGERLEYRRAGDEMELFDAVTLQHQPADKDVETRATADRLLYRGSEDVAELFGRVIVQQGGDVVSGGYAHVNLKTDPGDRARRPAHRRAHIRRDAAAQEISRAETVSRLSADNLSKQYKGRRVVAGVSLEIKSGEIVGLLGPNGAGKTTCFYMIVGLGAGGWRQHRARRHRREFPADAPGARASAWVSAAGAVGVPPPDGREEHHGDPRRRAPS